MVRPHPPDFGGCQVGAYELPILVVRKSFDQTSWPARTGCGDEIRRNLFGEGPLPSHTPPSSTAPVGNVLVRRPSARNSYAWFTGRHCTVGIQPDEIRRIGSEGLSPVANEASELRTAGLLERLCAAIGMADGRSMGEVSETLKPGETPGLDWAAPS